MDTLIARFCKSLCCILLPGLLQPTYAVHAELAQMVHQPLKSVTEGVAVQILVGFTPANLRIYQAKLYYRSEGQTTYHYRQMVPQPGGWAAEIPAADVRKPVVQYFISAAVENDLVLTWPEFNPYNRPETMEVTAAVAPQVVVQEIIKAPSTRPDSVRTVKPPALSNAFPEIHLTHTPKDSTPPSAPVKETTRTTETAVLILTPEEDESVTAAEINIAISLIAGDVLVDSASVKITLDDLDVTSMSAISPSLATYEPKHLKPGKHVLHVDAKTGDGFELPTSTVHFSIAEEKAAPAKTKNIQAHIFADLRSEEIMKKGQSFYVGGVDFSGQYGSLQYEGNVYLTSLEKKYDQPRDQFHLGLYSKWLGVSAGDNHPMYNDLILWGKRVRGLSGYIHLGFLNLDMVAGETNRAVDGTVINSASPNSYSHGVYQQNLLAVRPSFGSGKRFQLGLTFAKIKDDAKSIVHGTMPKDNLVMGPDFKLAFDRGRFLIEGSAAMSFLTEDTTPGAVTSSEIKSAFGSDTELPIDPASLSRYLIINESTTPLDPLKKTSMAYNTSVKLDYFHNLLQVGYKSIGGSYMSLANAWLRKDLEGWYFNDRVRLLNNKLYLTLGYEDYLDNFSQQNANPTVMLKTLNYSVTVYPRQGWPQFTVSMRDHHRDNGVQAVDTLQVDNRDLIVDSREKQIFRDLSVQMGYERSLFNLQHTLNISYVSTRNIDEYNNSRLAGSFGREMTTGVVLFTLNTQYSQPLKTTISLASNQNGGSLGSHNLDYIMYALGAEYGLWHNRLTVLVDGRRMHMSSSGANASSLNRDQARLGATLQITPRHTVLLDLNLIKMRSTVSTLDSYTDKLFRLRYDRYF